MTDNTPEGLPPLADLSEALARGREPRKLWPVLHSVDDTTKSNLPQLQWPTWRSSHRDEPQRCISGSAGWRVGALPCDSDGDDDERPTKPITEEQKAALVSGFGAGLRNQPRNKLAAGDKL